MKYYYGDHLQRSKASRIFGKMGYMDSCRKTFKSENIMTVTSIYVYIYKNIYFTRLTEEVLSNHKKIFHIGALTYLTTFQPTLGS